MYTSLINYYKLSRNYFKAATLLLDKCKLYDDLEFDQLDHVNTLADAATMFEKADMYDDAMTYYHAAMDEYVMLGNFNTASKIATSLANVYGLQDKHEDAVTHFLKAAEFTVMVNDSSSQVTKNQLAACNILITNLKQYDKAIELLNTVLEKLSENHLLKQTLSEHIFTALLCMLALEDLVRAQTELQNYISRYPIFEDSRYCKLFVKLLTSYEKFDADLFVSSLQEYNNISRLNDFYVDLLLTIKNSMTKTGSEAGVIDLC